MTLSDYLLSEIEWMAKNSTMSGCLERVRSRTSVASDQPPDVAIRRFRDADDPRDLGWVVLIVLDASAAIAVSLNLGTSRSAILERLDGP
jgi:hypothetical protein